MAEVDKTEKYYQLFGQYYLNDGIYSWEEVDAHCGTLEECLECKEYAMRTSPEYVDFRVEYHIVTEVYGPEYNIESDWER